MAYSGPLFGGWPFGDLAPQAYGMIMADPPWEFKNRSPRGEAKNAKAQYRCMTISEIRDLPVVDLAAPDCVLWLWATNPMLPQALETLRAWGFTFKTAGHWAKQTRTGKQAFGTGYILRCAGEPFLIGTRGDPVFARNVRSVVLGPVREHSRKPDQAYRAAELLCPRAGRRADLFTRQQRPGWQAWGDEVHKFAEGGASAD